MDLYEGYWNQKYFPYLNKFKPVCPSDIKERLPNIVFTGNLSSISQYYTALKLTTTNTKKGPSDLYQHRVRPGSPHEIGIGKASGLRTLDACYLTRLASFFCHYFHRYLTK